VILIVSKPGDLHAEAVMREIGLQGGASHLLDLSRFPAEARLSVAYRDAGLQIDYAEIGEAVDLSAVRAVWWRRPQPFGFEDGLDCGINGRFAHNECREAIDGLWQLLDAYWVNDPLRDDRAHRKLLQLKIATELGISIPRTLVTSDPARAKAFLAEGTNIYKPFSGLEEAWRETRLVGSEERSSLDLVRHAPVIFQRYVEGVDVRVTVVGDAVFAAEIDVRAADYPVDFRMSMAGARIDRCTLPEAVTRSIHALMRKLGLVYGALDFRRRPDGTYVFLEINPAGQWLFVEDATGLPIARRLAAHLVAADRPAAFAALGSTAPDFVVPG
jgi:hypothetical protein